jgi:hypothetical protein
MKPVYPQLPRRSGAAAGCVVALSLLLSIACAKGAPGGDETATPAMRPRHFALDDFLASNGSAADSLDAVRLAAERGVSWTAEPAPPAPPPLYDPPAGFRVAAVAPRGDRIALIRDLDPDTTEVLLHDRPRGETRLLLPIDRDARFLPQRFSADGSRLFLFTDEGGDALQLEILEPDSGRRERRPRPGCIASRLDPSRDGVVYSLQWTCSGAVEAALFESVGGAAIGPMPLPRGTRLARALPTASAGGALYEVASARYPRDLMFAARLGPDATATPLSYGLAPAIAAADLVDPAVVELRITGAAPSLAAVPAEVWWPRTASASPPALIWVESDGAPPAWLEFHPYFQFLANRGVAVLRLRLRGFRGFGKRLAHAADGRLVDAGMEDLEAARSELAKRGADPHRIALVGEGAWAGALVAAALAEQPGRFAAAADLGGDPDPLQRQDAVAELPEPEKSWWLARLGDPASELARRDRARMRLPALLPANLLVLPEGPVATAPDRETFVALWEFLVRRLDVTP